MYNKQIIHDKLSWRPKITSVRTAYMYVYARHFSHELIQFKCGRKLQLTTHIKLSKSIIRCFVRWSRLRSGRLKVKVNEMLTGKQLLHMMHRTCHVTSSRPIAFLSFSSCQKFPQFYNDQIAGSSSSSSNQHLLSLLVLALEIMDEEARPLGLTINWSKIQTMLDPAPACNRATWGYNVTAWIVSLRRLSDPF